MNLRSRLAEFFALKRNLAILLLAIFVIGAGEELWIRFLPKYMQALGAGVFVIGLFDALRTLLGAIYAYPGGLAGRSLGVSPRFLAFNILSIAGYSVVLLIPHWGAVIAGMFLFLSWTCFSLPATFSLIGANLGANRHAMGVGMQAVIKRLPIMFAPIVGGYAHRSLRRHRWRSHRTRLRSCSPSHHRATRTARRTRAGSTRERWDFGEACEPSTATAPAPLERYSGSILRANSVRLGRDLRNGYRRHEREGGRRLDHDRNGRRPPCASFRLRISPINTGANRSSSSPSSFSLFSRSCSGFPQLRMLMMAFAIRGLKEFGDTSRKALIIGYAIRTAGANDRRLLSGS